MLFLRGDVTYMEKIIVQTDRNSLRNFFTHTRLSPLQVRWLENLAPYAFETRHIKGKANKVAYGISLQTTHSNVDMQYPQEFLPNLKRKVLQVHNIGTVTSVKK